MNTEQVWYNLKPVSSSSSFISFVNSIVSPPQFCLFASDEITRGPNNANETDAYFIKENAIDPDFINQNRHSKVNSEITYLKNDNPFLLSKVKLMEDYIQQMHSNLQQLFENQQKHKNSAIESSMLENLHLRLVIGSREERIMEQQDHMFQLQVKLTRLGGEMRILKKHYLNEKLKNACKLTQSKLTQTASIEKIYISKGYTNNPNIITERRHVDDLLFNSETKRSNDVKQEANNVSAMIKKPIKDFLLIEGKTSCEPERTGLLYNFLGNRKNSSLPRKIILPEKTTNMNNRDFTVSCLDSKQLDNSNFAYKLGSKTNNLHQTCLFDIELNAAKMNKELSKLESLVNFFFSQLG